MITIKIQKPEKLRATPLCSMSGFVSFSYDTEIIEYLKNIQNRVYHPETKTWEIAGTAIPAFCNKFLDHKIEISTVWQQEKKHEVQLPFDYKFKTTPFNHQVEAILFGLEHDSFLLGDDQGLGKTKTIIDLALIKKKTEGLKHCLIICGVNGNKYNWAEEIKLHSDEEGWILGTRYTKRHPIRAKEGTSQDKLDDLKNLPNNFFIITNIETLRQLSYEEKHKKKFPIAEQIKHLCEKGDIGMVAFDEAHKAKNPTSYQGQALMLIQPKYAIPMSGTFLMNNPLDLYFPLYWTGFETHSFYQYKQHYCVLGGYGGSEVLGYKNLGDLRNLLDLIMIRRLKSEVLDLPPKLHTVEYVDLGPEQKNIYTEVLNGVRIDIDKIRLLPDPLSKLIRLRQATGLPEIISTKKIPCAKLDRLEELIDEILAVNQKVIIYSQWEVVTTAILNKLSQKIKKPISYITGKITAQDRMKEINNFQTNPECSIIIGTVGAMGTGITLNAASNVIFVDEPWNRALKDQAEDRAHRIGTKGVVRVITLIAKNTIDERIYELVQKKGHMSDLLIDGKAESNVTRELLDYILA